MNTPLSHAVLATSFPQASPKLLAAVLGGVAGLLLFTGFFIFCCVKCWHRRVSEPPQTPLTPSPGL